MSGAEDQWNEDDDEDLPPPPPPRYESQDDSDSAASENEAPILAKCLYPFESTCDVELDLKVRVAAAVALPTCG